MMPVMGGMEMCRKLKNDPRTSHIPVIILTAKADKASKLKGLEVEADDYISKPFDLEELKLRVNNLIKQRKKLREIFRKQLLDHRKPLEQKGHQDQLIKRLLETFEQNYKDYDFSVDDMGKEMLMSRAQFYRKVNALTDTSPNELLRLFRINKAATLLESDDLNITAIMYEVGFRSTSHFAESFRKYYGKNPSEYRDSLPFEK
jgi:AraC-like DNA-binding protein